MFDYFQGQTNIATFDVGLNIFSKARSIVFPANELSGFIDTKMAYQQIVVMPANKLCSNDFRHKR